MADESSDPITNFSTTLSTIAVPAKDSAKVAAAAANNITKPQTADGGDGLFTGFNVNDGMLMRVTYV